MCIYVGSEPAGDDQGSTSGDLSAITTGERGGDAGDARGDVPVMQLTAGHDGMDSLVSDPRA